ncbi:MAG: hypothetical protein A2751_01765 [Candidatus Doudnabacteria bacterium RIFCSPHIGHO2_01_FULL_46_14]|uniref:Uncharacterized protein n=1 Tax=Candidatus Doudnabacteria bacterium RIFCSPHIGHO2_01_FULL_46_14 TaxID=1817824 RepID=A0A1F5NJT6_9BACT|nr:MAG: hypothetical protein A2751_01765 [Candidatus Doudnabacteria bacterium RIFCSPHIGHO2_01_FULL_46_14]
MGGGASKKKTGDFSIYENSPAFFISNLPLLIRLRIILPSPSLGSKLRRAGKKRKKGIFYSL